MIANLGKKYPEAHETYCFSGRHLLLSFLDNAAPDVSLLRTFPGCFYPRCAGASDHPTQYVVCNYYVRSTSCVSCSAADNEHTCWLMHYPPLTHTSGIVESIASRFFPLVTVVLLRSLLNRLTRRIPYAEPDDLATILFSAQHYCSRDAHQIQPVAVAEKWVLTVILFHVPYPTASIYRYALLI